MTGDNNKESNPKGSDESLEQRKLAGKSGSDKTEAVGKPEQVEASAILSEAANKNPQEQPAAPLKGLVAMQGVLDPGLGAPATEADKTVENKVPVDGEVVTKPIKTPDDMYERMFDNNRSQGQTKFSLGAEFWNEVPAEKQVKEVQNQADAKGDSTTIVSDMNNAHVPFGTKSKVVLHINTSESIYKEAPIKATEKQPIIAKAKESKDTQTKDTTIAKQDVPKAIDFPKQIAKATDAKPEIAQNLSFDVSSSGTGRAIDQTGKTIGHWFNGGQKLVMSLSIDVNLKDANQKETQKNETATTAKPLQAASNTTNTTRTTAESFVPPDIAGPLTDQPKQTAYVSLSETTQIAQTANEVVRQQKDVLANASAEVSHVEPARAIENITKVLAPVQEQTDTTHPLGAALVQKASAVQRDVQDVISAKGAKQEQAVQSLERSVKDYNNLLESNKVTVALADKLKISSTDVDALKSSVDAGRLSTAKIGDESSKLASTAIGLSTLRDQAHDSLVKTIDRIEQSKDHDLIPRLFQTAMVLSLATSRDLSSPVYSNIPAATFNRTVAADASSPRIDFAPDRDTLTVSQDSRAGATPMNAAQTNAQAITQDGQSVRLDNAVNPVFSAIAFNAGTKETNETFVRLVEERVEAQRLYQELPDWMKEKGFRIALSPGAPPPAESTSKPAIAATLPWIRGAGQGDARIVAPTFKPLSILGDRHTLTGPMQGIPKVLGGFDAISLAQYNHLMQLLQTTEERVTAKTAKGQGVAVGSQSDNLVRRYPFLVASHAQRQSALYAKPDAGVELTQSATAATATVSADPVVASAAGQQEPPASQSSPSSQDEEA